MRPAPCTLQRVHLAIAPCNPARLHGCRSSTRRRAGTGPTRPGSIACSARRGSTRRVLRSQRHEERGLFEELTRRPLVLLSSFRSAGRVLRTAGMKRPDLSYQQIEYKLSEQLRQRFPQMTSLPMGNEYQIVKAELGEKGRQTSERRRCANPNDDAASQMAACLVSPLCLSTAARALPRLLRQCCLIDRNTGASLQCGSRPRKARMSG